MFLRSVFELVYPNLCSACQDERPLPGHFFCLECLSQFPETGFHLQSQNPFTKHFQGRFTFDTGASFLYFSRKGITQEILHRIKYHNEPELAIKLGQWYGKQLRESPWWQQTDFIIPVPLHWKKERLRGYNQSAKFAEGIGDVLECKVSSKLLIRKTSSSSLTSMNRWQRMETMQTVFELKNLTLLKGKHVLLVDDVLTTGATLEACALQLLDSKPASLKLLTIATGEL